MLVLLLSHFGLAASVPFVARRLGRATFVLAAAAPAAALVWAGFRLAEVVSGGSVTASLAWAPQLGLWFALRFDALASAMVALVAGVGVVVLVYCSRYFERDEPGLGRMAGLLVAFAGAMLGLVLADHLLALYVFWELTTVCSFLLIGHRRDEESRHAAVHALLVTTGLGLFMLVGLVLLGQAADTYRISALLAEPPEGGPVSVAVVLILLGAFAKSAQVPFHGWLPAAMVAPTPVSAYLHAAAMVQAGVYLVARLAPAFADVAAWRPLVLSVGLVTMLQGGWRALREDDLKRLLALGTVSQLGLLMVLFGAGSRTAALAGVAVLLAHGLFKAALFLTAGVADRQTGTTRLDGSTGLWRRMPGLFGAAVLAAASMAGLPPLLGYVGKEAAYEAFLHEGVPALVLAGIVAGSILTVGYSVRYLWGAFGGKPHTLTAAPVPLPRVLGLVAPAATLALASLGLGLLPGEVHVLAAAYADVFAGGEEYHLALWSGWTPAFLLSAVTIAAGLALHPLRQWIEGAVVRVPDAGAVYRATLRGLDLAAVTVTRRIQVGSLPVYLTVILTTLVATPGVALVSHGALPSTLRLWDTPVQLMLGLLILTASAGVAVARRRFTAVLLLGAAGYGVAALFVVHGAPDLALAQFLVETLLLVVFLFVLRRLPPRFLEARQRPPVSHAGAAALAGLLGVFVGGFFLLAATARRWPSVSAGYLDRAREAGGTNIVNLILVDFRALDTLGEVSVLAVAATGVASLVLVAWRGVGGGDGDPAMTEESEKRRRRRLTPRAREAPRRRWLAAPYGPPLGPRSVLLEAATRIVVPTALVLSAYLLLAGHERTGGGFAGGLVAGMAFVLRYVAGGRYELTAAAPVRPASVIGLGLFVAAGMAVPGWVGGGEIFAGTVLEATLPVLGHVKLVTSFFFDLGIYLVVVGLVLEILTALGAQVEEEGGLAQ
ncbi:MAG: Na+/H+ antiporter subunit A [Streptosporangiales bacterium]|nr:Na+/H+ antiporter subunit A [Streptosporangiales bacterium]